LLRINPLLYALDRDQLLISTQMHVSLNGIRMQRLDNFSPLLWLCMEHLRHLGSVM